MKRPHRLTGKHPDTGTKKRKKKNFFSQVVILAILDPELKHENVFIGNNIGALTIFLFCK